MPGYQTKQQDIQIAGADDLVIRSLLDRQQFSDPLGVAAALGINSSHWPLFGLLWPSGAQLAARMAARALRPGERILEIGCGLALASLVAHRRGADVTASDRHPLAARFLAANLRLNNLPPMRYRHGEWALPPDVATDAAADTAFHAAPDAGPPPASARVVHGGQQRASVHGRYDFVIGSDVLYDRDASLALAGFIARHTADAAEVWIVDPDRGNRPGFTRRMAAAGFKVHDQRLDQAGSGPHPAYKGRLLVYRRDS